MTALDRRTLGWAMGLSMLAGYVDALGFIELGGIFVSFMSGNTTKIGIAVGEGQWQIAGHVLGVIALFVVGVVLGSLLARRSKGNRWRHVLSLVAGMLGLSAVSYQLSWGLLGMVLMVLAMGAENTVLRRDGVSVGLTYMTGNLVRMGHSLSDMLSGGSKRDWMRYFLLWAGLTTGAILGAVSFRILGMNGLWIGAAGAVALSGRRPEVHLPSGATT